MEKLTEILMKMERIWDKLENPMTETMEMAAMGTFGVILLVGLLNVFLGYRLMRFWMMLGGFALGVGGGVFVGYHLGLSRNSLLLLAGVLAVVCAVLSFIIYTWGIFVLSMFLGAGISIYVVHPTTSLSFFLCILLGVGMGVLGVKFSREIIIVGTSLLGGLMAGMSISNYTDLPSLPFGLLMGVAIGLLGMLVQFRLNPEEED